MFSPHGFVLNCNLKILFVNWDFNFLVISMLFQVQPHRFVIELLFFPFLFPKMDVFYCVSIANTVIDYCMNISLIILMYLLSSFVNAPRLSSMQRTLLYTSFLDADILSTPSLRYKKQCIVINVFLLLSTCPYSY